MQQNGEYKHCQDKENFGMAKFKCKKTKENNPTNTKGVRCSCKNSRANRIVIIVF